MSCVLGSILMFGSVGFSAAADGRYYVYIGTYTRGKSQGIYRAPFDATTGKLGAPELAVATPNPTFLAPHPKLPILYAVGRVSATATNQSKEGTVTGFSINQTGGLTPINQQSSGAEGPCHVSVDAAGQCVFVANYAGGCAAVFPLENEGRLKQHSGIIRLNSPLNPARNLKRQDRAHSHWIGTSPDNRFVFMCDLGCDKIATLAFQFDPVKRELIPSKITLTDTPPGTGPRHLAFSPNGRFVALIAELSNSITMYSSNPADGSLKEIQTVSTRPSGFTNANTAAEIAFAPSGKFLYGSNRGHDSIAIFAVAPDGHLTLKGHVSTQGKGPRHFGIDPTGRWLLAANENSGNVIVFAIDPATGHLTPNGQTIAVADPVCVVFIPIQ